MSRKTFLLFFAGFLITLPFFVFASTLCWDECSYSGQRQDSANQYRICGDYDSDYCLEWSAWQTTGPVCWDECSYQGQYECSNTSGRTCGNYDSDSCLEWSSWQSCYNSCYRCGDGTCNSSCGENSSNCPNDCDSCGSPPPSNPLCWDECSYTGQKRCADSSKYQTCGNYDSDYCLEWSSSQSCPSGQACQDGQCVSQCTSHYYKACYDNDVYWYDSCSKREEKAQECGYSSCLNGKCILPPTVITKGVVVTY